MKRFGGSVIKEKQSATGARKQIINIAVLAVLVGLTFYIILGSNKDFSFADFAGFLSNLKLGYVITAFAFLLLFIFFEGISLRLILKSFGYKKRFYQSMIYSASDIYYSAITPSATGGQPASVYYMSKDGVPVSVATAAVSFNISMYIASLMLIAVLCFLIRPWFFLQFGFVSKLLIIFGILIQLILFVVFMLIMVNKNILKKIASFFISVLAKLHLVKNPAQKLKGLDSTIKSYTDCIDLVKGNKSMAARALIYNFLQRVSQIAIALCIYLAVGIDTGSAIDVLVLQGYCLIGSNSVPLPGAVGVSEGLYLDAFKGMISKGSLCNCMMATRGISYYISFIFCGILTLVHHARITIKRKK